MESQLQAWIQPLKWLGVETEDEQVIVELGAPNDFSVRWVLDHHQSQIEAAISEVTGNKAKIRVRAVQQNSASASPETLSLENIQKNQEVNQGSGENPSSGIVGPTVRVTSSRGSVFTKTGKSQPSSFIRNIDSRYTFSHYVVGASNQFAHASAVAVAERPATQYNPLFLYAPPGLGKTHLLHAIGNAMLERNPEARVAYLSAESFVNDLIESIQNHRMTQFRARYRDTYDLLLIDDIQFIAGRHKTEEEFFHTFNALHGSRRQIVLTSDRPPKEIEGLEERIRTRFEWGLVADIQPPEIETRIAILKAKAERDDIYLPEDVATFIATHVKSNVRELEGLLIRLQAQASLTGAEISLEMAKQQLRLAIPEEGSHMTIETIQNVVSKHYGLKISDLKSSTRTKAIALPRQIAMYLSRKYTRIGFKEIGQYFGGKDHTTILHAYNKIEAGYENDNSIREAVETIQNLL